MRIVRFAHPQGMSFGVAEGADAAVTVAQIEGHPFGEIVFTGQRWALADVRLLSPILPSKVVCVGKNYADHATEMGGTAPEQPLLFLKPSTAVIGPGDPIRLPAVSRQVDHEAELAVVIGVRGARQLPAEQAMAAVFGYTCANDVTARDLQKTDGQWTRAKGFDSFCPIGPWIETQLDIADLGVRCEVDGELRQNGRTSQLVHSVATLISYVSHVMTLLPGDVLLTGTPAGVGPITAAQTVSVSIDGLGTLTNPVVAAS
ncbi:MAG: fumarylacetoacetate hydrolase family protein [Geodermatophilaceae bacterium]|nr:fumarylacetoacetate hydrolase family protein [Geodermatophilaceae bacterium]